jgi:hypothetical protein
VSDLAKLGVVIAALILLVRLKFRLSIALFASAAAIGLMFGLSPAQIASAARSGFLDAESLKIVFALQLVLLFSAITKEQGSMQRAISALSMVFRDARVTVAVIPAVIGLLPVVGGAMLSAPLVSEAADELGLSPERRTFLNYWFRHVWEYTLPTFPAVFLTAGIVGIPVGDLVLINLPLTAAAIAGGVVLGFRGVRPPRSSGIRLTPAACGRHLATFAWNLAPFFIVILLTVGGGIHLAYAMLGVTAGIVFLYRIPAARLQLLARRHLSLELAFLVWGIMVFKEMLTASNAMVGIVADLTRMGMPAAVLVAMVPALIAFITGYTTAFVGLSFPVLLPLLPSDGSAAAFVMLGLGAGICAHLLSPVHSCYVMTLEYYRADMGKTYRLLVGPVTVTFLAGVAVFAAARAFGGS